MYFNSTSLNVFARCYLWLISFFSNFQSLFLFVIRITWGHQFFVAGLGKFHRMESVVQFFQTLNIPFPSFSAYLVAIFEFVGGIFLIAGLGSRLVSLILAIEMFVAIGTAHMQVFADFKFISDPAILVREAPFPFLFVCLIILFFGPGKISLDAWIKRSLQNRHKF